MGTGFHGGFGKTTGAIQALKIGNLLGKHIEFTKESLIKELIGITPKSNEIAEMIQKKEIKLSVLGDSLFNRYLLGGRTNMEVIGVQIGNKIYVRMNSSTILSDIVHEGTHAIDFVRHLPQNLISSFDGEMKAYLEEHYFQIAKQIPTSFKNKEEIAVFVKKNYNKGD